jgi:hypothetical protein
VAIVVLALHYNDAQLAGSAHEFRRVVGGDGGRFAAAGVVDVAFALSYAALAWAVARRIGTLLARTGAVVVSVGAVFDVVENVLLLRNLGRGDALTDDAVASMVAAGGRKWAFAAAGVAVLLVSWLVERRRQPANASS